MTGDAPSLKRSLGLWETTLGGVGIILGAGIYALVGAVTAEAGNGVWLSFALAAAVALVLGLCYAELSSMFPFAGADYEYANRAVGARPAFLVGWLVSLGNIIAAAAISVALAGYAREYLDLRLEVIAIAALLIATAISIAGIKESLRVVIALTFVEVGGLVFIIAIGIPSLGDLKLTPFAHGPAGVIAGASLSMFAYNGYSQIAALSEEAHDASRVVPRAMLLAIVITMLLYMGVALASLAVLGAESLGLSNRPLADVASEVLGSRAAGLISIIAIFSSANSMLLHLVVGSRMIYGMAHDSALPAWLASVHPGLRTPIPAIVCALVISTAFALSGELAFVAGATSFTIFAGFFSVCVALLVLRMKSPDHPRPFRIPWDVRGIPPAPIIGIAATAALTAGLERDVLLVGGLLVACGIVAMLASHRQQHAAKE